MHPWGRRFHPGSFRSLHRTLEDVHPGSLCSLWLSLGTSGVVGYVRSYPGGRSVYLGPLGSLVRALGVLGFILSR